MNLYHATSARQKQAGMKLKPIIKPAQPSKQLSSLSELYTSLKILILSSYKYTFTQLTCYCDFFIMTTAKRKKIINFYNSRLLPPVTD
jgi:hypothetical protein